MKVMKSMKKDGDRERGKNRGNVASS